MDAPTYVSNAEIHTWGRDTEVGMAIDRRLGRRRGPTWTSWRRMMAAIAVVSVLITFENPENDNSRHY